MEFLADSYRILVEVRHQMESGRPLPEVLCELTKEPRRGFESSLVQWWRARGRGASGSVAQWFQIPLQRQFVATLDRGLRGESIIPVLEELEEEMRLASVDQIELHLQRLPALLLLPLMALIFPSLMLLLLGPIVLELMRSLN